ncbi:unnamed protein product [Cladocopium goreaui]|uniref:Uncharacterized protein n=1 Tax=Cladocopium goreaui TaxID=2562237 RepID=A0A9P1DBL5_9DINO|nr:unnamed protein product [Cladocopium goreaui]
MLTTLRQTLPAVGSSLNCLTQKIYLLTWKTHQLKFQCIKILYLLRPKHFWERFQVSQKLHLAGLSDHVTAFTSDSVVHMQIQQTELTVQHIIPSCVVAWFNALDGSDEAMVCVICSHAYRPTKRSRTTFKYGVWHEPEEFLQKALGVSHPIDQDSFLHQITKDAIIHVVGTCPTKLAKDRLSSVFHIKKLSTDLNPQEKELKSNLHPDVSRCVGSKNILLFEKLLQQLNYWDMAVVDLLKFGVPLVGLQEPPSGYQQLMVPASMTEEELMASAKWRRDSIMQTARPISKLEEDALLEATASEVEKGFLQGPYSESEMSVLSEGCRVLTLAFSALLDLLGWDHAKEGDKALNFAPAFDLLGVTFDLTSMSMGTLTVKNKTSRIDKLCEMLDQVARDKCISAAKASELQGLINFAVSFYLGRSMRHLVSAFMPFADKLRGANPGELENLCLYAKTMLLEQRPRVHSVLNEGRPIVVFTDGAWESGTATAGAVLIDGDVRLALKLDVPQDLVNHWLACAGDQIISQVELWGLVLLKWSRREHFHNRRVIEWIDNESARVSAIKASSNSPTMRALSRLMADVDLCWPSLSWTERVCSYSNPADLPSRDRLKEAMQRYNLEDGGTVQTPTVLVNALLQLCKSPYMLLTITGEKH